MELYSIGADIGGSHISCALVNVKDGRVVDGSYVECKVNNHGSADEILKSWCNALQMVLSKAGRENISGIGFAMPGPFDYSKGVALFERVAKFEHLYGMHIGNELIARLGVSPQMPIRFINDASAFAIGEAWLGKASKFTRSVSVTLGTGFGSAFVANGLPVVDGPNVPEMGCVWHLPFLDGIADDYFSTRWFEKRWFELTGQHVAGVKPIALQAGSNPLASQLFDEFGSNMGQFLAPWLKRFNAELLVVGGNILGAYPLFGNAFEKTLAAQSVWIEVALSKLKESAAIIGGARLSEPCYWAQVAPVLSKM